MLLLLLFLLLLSGCQGIIKNFCSKWYAQYGCENTMVLIKNIYMYDYTSFLSTQLLSHNPEKKITCLIDFGLPNNLKKEIINSIIQDQSYSGSYSNNSGLVSTVTISKLKYLSKYMDSFIINNIPLYIYKSSYDSFGLNQGIYDSYLEHGTKLQLSTKGKPFNFQINIVSYKNTISTIWNNAIQSSKYDAVLNLGKNSNLWSNYNYLFISIDKMIYLHQVILMKIRLI